MRDYTDTTLIHSYTKKKWLIVSRTHTRDQTILIELRDTEIRLFSYNLRIENLDVDVNYI